jgi:UDP-glucose 4-epimerase
MNKDILTFYNNKKILITGGRGYLGSILTNILGHADCKIIRLGRSEVDQNLKGIKADVTDIKGDIRHKKTWVDNLEEVDFVFHFAAQTSVYKAEQNAFEDFRANVLPMFHLLEVCKENKWQPSILFAGTVTEAGIPDTIPIDETYTDQPVTVYDLHKLMAEKYLRHYANQGFVQGVILRLANVYGPGPKSSSVDRGVLNMMIQRASRGDDLTLYGKGDNLRDYIYVKDVISAFLVAGIKMDILNGRYFVIGSGIGHTLKEAFELVIERVKIIAGRTVNLVEIKPPQAQPSIDVRDFVADVSAFQSLTNWEPNYTLQSGIDNTIDCFNN